MSHKRRKRIKWAQMQVENVKFTVEKGRSDPKKKVRGWITFDFVRRVEGVDNPTETQHKMQLISAWADEEENAVVRSLVYLDRSMPQNFGFIRDSQETDFIPVKDPGVDCQMCMSVNSGCVYFGPPPGEKYNNWSNEGESYTFYRSRPEVMREIFRFARDSRKQIGGDKLIALDRISPKLLLRFGFTQVGDMFSNSPPMWKGDVSQLVRPDSYSHAYRDQRNSLDNLLEVIQNAI